MELTSSLHINPLVGIKSVSSDFLRKGYEHLHDHFIPNPRNNYHPHILGHRALALISLFLVVFKVSSIIALITLAPAPSAYSSAINSTNVFNLTNSSRTSNNLPALTQNKLLAEAAAAKAQALVVCQCFSHNIGDKTPWSFIKAAGYNYISAGENLAVDFTDAENVEDAWMNSPGHRANILNKNYEEIGIGIAKGFYQGHDTTFIVQMFGTPLDQPIVVQDQPTKVAPVAKTNPVISAKTVASSPTVKISSTSPTVVTGKPNGPKNAVVETSNNIPLIQPDTLIVDSKFVNSDSDLKLSIKTATSVVKLIAAYGDSAVMLDPKGNNIWEGTVSLASLAGSKVLTLLAYDLSGKPYQQQLADFSPSLQDSYKVLGETSTQTISVLGKSFDPKQVEGKFYLLFIAGMLSTLILAIGIKRHIQHLGLIANGSFVIILAALFWMAG